MANLQWPPFVLVCVSYVCHMCVICVPYVCHMCVISYMCVISVSSMYIYLMQQQHAYNSNSYVTSFISLTSAVTSDVGDMTDAVTRKLLMSVTSHVTDMKDVT